jgi:hypothetical protein
MEAIQSLNKHDHTQNKTDFLLITKVVCMLNYLRTRKQAYLVSKKNAIVKGKKK